MIDYEVTPIEDYPDYEDISRRIVEFNKSNDPDNKYGFKNKFSYDEVNDIIYDDTCAFYIFESEDNIIGYVSVDLMDGYIELSDIIVMSSLRGKGYGKRFIEYAIYENDAVETRLQVDCNNSNAIIAYLKMGFIPIGFISGYYANGNDCIYMRRLEGCD